MRRLDPSAAPAVALVALLGLAAAANPGHAQERYAMGLELWADVLEAFVDAEGRTDFDALAADRADLDRFVALVAQYGPNSNPEDFATPDAVLAYHINAYNALAMHGVIEAGIPDDFDGFFKRAGFFRFREIVVDGRETNLYDYENRVIRPLDEARVHFALNCMVRACPRLPREPFTADHLDRQLEQATREFFASGKHLRLDAEAEVVQVSEILDFYTRDFVSGGKRRDLIGYINRYVAQPIPPDYRVRFIPYDWTINRQPD